MNCRANIRTFIALFHSLIILQRKQLPFQKQEHTQRRNILQYKDLCLVRNQEIKWEPKVWSAITEHIRVNRINCEQRETKVLSQNCCQTFIMMTMFALIHVIKGIWSVKQSSDDWQMEAVRNGIWSGKQRTKK